MYNLRIRAASPYASSGFANLRWFTSNCERITLNRGGEWLSCPQTPPSALQSALVHQWSSLIWAIILDCSSKVCNVIRKIVWYCFKRLQRLYLWCFIYFSNGADCYISSHKIVQSKKLLEMYVYSIKSQRANYACTPFELRSCNPIDLNYSPYC